jgi:hypothetical protein
MAKKELQFKSIDSLQPIVVLVNEASEALKDKNRIIVNSPISEVLGAALGAGAGGAISYAALFTGGVTVGVSAAGITSGLAAAGAIVGGGMVAGVFVLAAPVAVLAVGGYGVLNSKKNKKLKQEKERLYQEVLRKHDSLINQLKIKTDETKERADYLNSLVILLARALKDLKGDLDGE